MQFVNAIWLWGLAGLIVPISIHLLSRKQGKVIRFGSIRHLDETSTRQFRAMRLNELVLLTLRCVFIVLLVLMLAGIQFSISKQQHKWLLIERGLENDPEYAPLIDSLKGNGFEIKSLSATSPTVASEKTDYWNIIEELEPGEDVVVLSYNYADGFKGKRISLPDGVRWLSADPDSMEYVLKAVKLSDDSIVIRRGNSRSDKTSFQNLITANQDLDSAILEPRDTVSTAVVFDSSYEHDKNILMAALQAVQKKSLVLLQAEAIPADGWSGDVQHDWTIWFSEKARPEMTGNLILMDENNVHQEDLITQTSASSNNTWILTKRLNEQIALQQNLAVQLAMILEHKEKYLDRMKQFDRRVLPEKLRWSSLPEEPGTLKAGSDNKAGAEYISIALLLILFVERLLAFKRDQ
jgi:hypothetical protein